MVFPRKPAIPVENSRLVPIGEPFRVRLSTSSEYYVVCECKCGSIVAVSCKHIRRGTLSCGCLQREKNKTHGFAPGKNQQHRLYRIWAGIKTRCCNPKCHGYQRYGGRGIAMCVEWSNDPAAFIRWGMAHGWQRGLDIDRINNDGPYSPENCRFVTRAENATNRHNTVRLVWKGETLHISGWARKLGLHASTVWDRYYRGVRPPELFAIPRDGHHG